jgi:hypothetical protein
MKVGPNDLIYPLVIFHIFLRLLTIFTDLIPFLCVWKRLNKKSKIVSYFLSDRTHKTRPDNRLHQTHDFLAHMPVAHLLYSVPHGPLGRVPPRSSPIPRAPPARSDHRYESWARGVLKTPPHMRSLVTAIKQSVPPFLLESRHSSVIPVSTAPHPPIGRHSWRASHPTQTGDVPTSLCSDRCIPQHVPPHSPN